MGATSRSRRSPIHRLAVFARRWRSRLRKRAKGGWKLISESWWPIPLACVVGSLVLAAVVGALDQVIDEVSNGDSGAWFLFEGNPTGARDILSTVSTSMLTFTGLVFSVTILVLQNASTQFSPRVLRTFLKDRRSQGALGLFVGTFTYALVGLRSVRGETAELSPYVPSLTVWLAVVLAIGSVVAFVFFIHHIAQSIRASVIIRRIGAETRASIQKLYPKNAGQQDDDDDLDVLPDSPPVAVIRSTAASGILASVDEEELFETAVEADAVIALVPLPGDFVPRGSALALVWGDAAEVDDLAVEQAVTLAAERDQEQDSGFGFRELVDIGSRALSSGVNDPTTAVQVLDELHDLLRHLAVRRFPSPARRDERGRLRLVLPRPDFDSYVRLALEELRQYGGDSVQVARRMKFLLTELLSMAPTYRRGELERQQRLLDAEVERSFPSKEERRMAHRPGAQSHGPLDTDRPEP